jgi:solute carrier family 25 protein 44
VFICSHLEQLEKKCPVNTSLLFLQSISGVLAGFTTTLITNPMDTIRARLQVNIDKKNYKLRFHYY